MWTVLKTIVPRPWWWWLLLPLAVEGSCAKLHVRSRGGGDFSHWLFRSHSPCCAESPEEAGWRNGLESLNLGTYCWFWLPRKEVGVWLKRHFECFCILLNCGIAISINTLPPTPSQRGEFVFTSSTPEPLLGYSSESVAKAEDPGRVDGFPESSSRERGTWAGRKVSFSWRWLEGVFLTRVERRRRQVSGEVDM